MRAEGEGFATLCHGLNAISTLTWSRSNCSTSASNFSHLTEPQDRLERDASFAVFGRLVDLVQRVELDQLFEGKPTLLVQLDKLGNEDLRYAVAFHDPPDRPT